MGASQSEPLHPLEAIYGVDTGSPGSDWQHDPDWEPWEKVVEKKKNSAKSKKPPKDVENQTLCSSGTVMHEVREMEVSQPSDLGEESSLLLKDIKSEAVEEEQQQETFFSLTDLKSEAEKEAVFSLTDLKSEAEKAAVFSLTDLKSEAEKEAVFSLTDLKSEAEKEAVFLLKDLKSEAYEEDEQVSSMIEDEEVESNPIDEQREVEETVSSIIVDEEVDSNPINEQREEENFVSAEERLDSDSDSVIFMDEIECDNHSDSVIFLEEIESQPSASDDVYVVEEILDKCIARHGVSYYLVKWKGCSIEESTWEPEENLYYCEGAIQKFLQERRERRQKKRLLWS